MPPPQTSFWTRNYVFSSTPFGDDLESFERIKQVQSVPQHSRSSHSSHDAKSPTHSQKPERRIGANRSLSLDGAQGRCARLHRARAHAPRAVHAQDAVGATNATKPKQGHVHQSLVCCVRACARQFSLSLFGRSGERQKMGGLLLPSFPTRGGERRAASSRRRGVVSTRRRERTCERKRRNRRDAATSALKVEARFSV